MESLDDYEALELFSLNAFGGKHPAEDLEEFASKIVKYLHGHPLALKVIGRSLYEKSVDFWKSEFERLQTYPNSEIVQKLRPSFDSLASDQKRMFLDIAFAFIGENKDFAASVLDGSHCSANAVIEVLADKFLITVYEDCHQMHELIQSMAREITREEFTMLGKQRRLRISSASSEKKVEMTEAIEVLVLLLRKSSQEVHINTNSFALMKNLRILKIYAEEGFDQKRELKGYNVKYSGSLYFLSNELSLFCWHGCPFKYLPSNFHPENIVAIDLSYSNIKQLWTTPKCLRRLKIMKLRHCCNLTTTPDFSEITNLEELSLEGCVNLVSIHPSIGILKRLVVLNLRDCKRLQNFPSRVEMHALQVLNLTGCLKVDQLSEALGRIKTLTELHIDRTAITELPSFVSSLVNLESLSFGGQGRIQPRWWTSITAPFGLLSKQQHPQRSISLAGLHMLKSLNLSYCNLVQVPESIGGLSCLKELNLRGNNFTSLSGSLSQLSSLNWLNVDGCKKLEVLPELPPGLYRIYASDCTSLREVSGSSKDPFSFRENEFRNCPKLFKNVTIDSDGKTSQGFSHQLSALLGYMGFLTNKREFFLQDTGYYAFDIIYHGNSSIPEWFTNRNKGNGVKVELPSYKFRGFGTCVVFKCKKPHKLKGYSLKNFDGALLNHVGFPASIKVYLKKEVIGIQDSYMIWLHYTNDTWKWEEAKNFVTFSFEDNNEDVEVKECGARLICREDVTSMFQDIATQSQHGGALNYFGPLGHIEWSW